MFIVISNHDSTHTSYKEPYVKAHIDPSQARREAWRLFRDLRRRCNPQKEEAIRIVFPQRFPVGKGIVAALVPIDAETIQMVGNIARAHRGYHYPPALINSGGERRLRLIWRFPGVCSCDSRTLLQIATGIAAWAEDLFARKAIVFPDDGLVATRLRLRIE